MFIHLSLKYVGSLGLHQPLILRFLFAAGKTTKNASPQEKKPTIPMTHLGLPDGPQSPRVTCLPSCFALASSSRERTWRRIVTSARAAEERRELNAFQWRHGIALCDQNGFMKIGIYIYIYPGYINGTCFSLHLEKRCRKSLKYMAFLIRKRMI